MTTYRSQLDKLVTAAAATVKKSRTLANLEADEARREREELLQGQSSTQGDTEPSG